MTAEPRISIESGWSISWVQLESGIQHIDFNQFQFIWLASFGYICSKAPPPPLTLPPPHFKPIRETVKPCVDVEIIFFGKEFQPLVKWLILQFSAGQQLERKAFLPLGDNPLVYISSSELFNALVWLTVDDHHVECAALKLMMTFGLFIFFYL